MLAVVARRGLPLLLQHTGATGPAVGGGAARHPRDRGGRETEQRCLVLCARHRHRAVLDQASSNRDQNEAKLKRLTLYTTPVIYLYLGHLSKWLAAQRRQRTIAANQ